MLHTSRNWELMMIKSLSDKVLHTSQCDKMGNMFALENFTWENQMGESQENKQLKFSGMIIMTEVGIAVSTWE